MTSRRRMKRQECPPALAMHVLDRKHLPSRLGESDKPSPTARPVHQHTYSIAHRPHGLPSSRRSKRNRHTRSAKTERRKVTVERPHGDSYPQPVQFCLAIVSSTGRPGIVLPAESRRSLNTLSRYIAVALSIRTIGGTRGRLLNHRERELRPEI
jgi:hypothetical protein